MEKLSRLSIRRWCSGRWREILFILRQGKEKRPGPAPRRQPTDDAADGDGRFSSSSVKERRSGRGRRRGVNRPLDGRQRHLDRSDARGWFKHWGASSSNHTLDRFITLLPIFPPFHPPVNPPSALFAPLPCLFLVTCHLTNWQSTS